MLPLCMLWESVPCQGLRRACPLSVNPCLPHAERVHLGLTPDETVALPAPEPVAPGVPCVNPDTGVPCNGSKKCRACEGTKRVRFILFNGRWRTRVEIAQWFIAQPEWKGAAIRTMGGNLLLKHYGCVMRLENFTADELKLFPARDQIFAARSPRRFAQPNYDTREAWRPDVPETVD